MTDKELRDAAVVELKKTTQGYLKSNGQPRALVGAQWKKGLDLLAQIGGGIPPPPPSLTVPASRVVLDPGEIAAWMVSDSPGTQIATIEPTSGNSHNLIAWAASQYLANPRYAAPQKMYALHGFRLVSGFPGRLFNYHTAPGDMPHGWAPLVRPGVTTYVSPLAIDYFGNDFGLHVVLEAEGFGGNPYHFPLLSKTETEARRGQWVWIWLEVVQGRRDLPIKGSLRAWLAGDTSPRVSLAGINTHWIEQHFAVLWEGAYNDDGVPSRVEVDIAARRIGRTPQECLADRPSVFVRYGAGSAAGPPGSAVAISDVASAAWMPAV